VVTENAASGTDTIRTTLTTFSLANVVNIENLTYVGAAVFTGTGDASANVISGGSGNDNLTGAGGDDRLDGGTGNDAMAGGGGNDTFVVDSIGDAVTENANAGTDTIETTLSAYSIANAANVENLTFTGTGAFSGVGNAAANTIRGGAGFDTLNGGAGADIMIGGNGGDLYYVDNAGDVVNELAGGGLDTIIVTLNNFSLANLGNVEQLFGGQGNFTGTGNAGANLIGGGAGSDSISGGGGNDRIGGGLGADTLNGGAGSDTFFFNTALGNGNVDAITDFSVVDDTIELSRAIFNGFQATGAVQANQFELGVNAASNGNTRLFVNNGGSLFYDADGSGVSVAVQIATLTVTGTLTAADFTVVA
jgi:Ca2+-binding RTX toxin-like protein